MDRYEELVAEQRDIERRAAALGVLVIRKKRNGYESKRIACPFHGREHYFFTKFRTCIERLEESQGVTDVSRLRAAIEALPNDPLHFCQDCTATSRCVDVGAVLDLVDAFAKARL